MCGIAGIIVTDPVNLNHSDLMSLATRLAHRGPDGEGIFLNSSGTVGLIHRRLAIIDISEHGHQPMNSKDGTYTIVFNGEIYNFIELRVELEALGSIFCSDSDTEVILEAWRHWGKSMLLRFNGMWALAILDNRSGDVFLARDRFGIKPLLYSQLFGRFAFASEMGALLAVSWVSNSLDRDVVSRLIFDPFSVEGSEFSIHSAVKRLPGGHMAELKQGQLTITRWWCTVDHLVDVPSTSEGQAEKFREIFFDSINLRLRSDVPVGTCLSGGFDSSAIVCAMSHIASNSLSKMREAQDWRHAFIASFPGYSNDETPQALEVANYAGVVPHVHNFGERDGLGSIDKVLKDMDDIYISVPTAPWQIYRELRRANILVSLDGHGADELMGAYFQMGQALNFKLRNHVAKLAQGSIGLGYLVDSAKAAWLSARNMNFLRGHAVTAPRSLPIPSDVDRLPTDWGVMNRRLYRMFHGTTLPTILRNFDRLSMAHGVEIRMPFMDWRLVTYVMSLPDASKLQQGRTKAVARDAMEGYMPDSIRLARLKVGFNSPMPELLNGSLGEWAKQLLSQDNPEFDSFVDRKALIKQVTVLNASRGWDWERAGRIWPYINLKCYLTANASVGTRS